jgi:hypothetical protein
LKRLATLAASAAAAMLIGAPAEAASVFTVDLPTGTVNGHVVIGRSFADLATDFGKPQWRVSGRFLRIGYGDRTNFSMMIRFKKRQNVWRAISVSFERSPLAETQISRNILSMPPFAFAAAVKRTYSGTLKVVTPVACRRSVCSVTFRVSSTGERIDFGRGATGLGQYLTVSLLSQ